SLLDSGAGRFAGGLACVFAPGFTGAFVPGLDGAEPVLLAGLVPEPGPLGPLPATAINLSMSSCEELISKFTWGCSKSGTFTVPLMSAAVARSATNCASSFPPDKVNLPV